MSQLTPEAFVEKWERASLKERASAQSHFDDVCRLLGFPTPAEADPDGDFFTYEYKVQKITGSRGFVDVWMRDHFAIEYKGPGQHQNLKAAYRQLLQYREDLRNPPILIVTDIKRWEVHTNFPNTAKQVYRFTNQELELSRYRRVLRDAFEDPNRLHPNRTPVQVTTEAAELFRVIADEMRDELQPERLAHFVTRLVFCLFAEDVGLLPTTPSGRGVFTEIVSETVDDPDDFVRYTSDLFASMAEGGGAFFRQIRYFDGSLFDDAQVERLSVGALAGLAEACTLNWSAVDPSIFGTLFERVLDPAKRAQLGAHYTSRADILLLTEPVLMAPLRRQWQTAQTEAAEARAAYDAAQTGRARQEALDQLDALRANMLAAIRATRVLDPACGSGNFLYVALQQLLDLEAEVIKSRLWRDVLAYEEPAVHPRQFHGIEVNPIAHELASIVVWIGFLQWHEEHGYHNVLDRNPLLEKYENIRYMDAILGVREDGTLYDPEWPEADVIVGNPPFLGGKRLRAELDNAYVDRLFALYEERVPHEADLVTYWFEKARAEIAQRAARRAGLLATNSIRGGANRAVLDRIKESGDIFMAWSDRAWVLEGAAVRISMVGFDDGTEDDHTLDGLPVTHINADLQNTIDATKARQLPENAGITFMGVTPAGPFDMPEKQARRLLSRTDNPHGRSNTDVMHPYYNAMDLARRPRGVWTIDFGTDMTEQEASQYRGPFAYVQEHVYPRRAKNRRKSYRENWWRYAEARPAMREAIAPLTRYLATPMVSKHRLYVWLDKDIVPANLLNVIARDDDYCFGVLHSRLHEVWSLRLGSWLGKGNDPRYTPTTTFETFPFPWPPGAEPAPTPRDTQQSRRPSPTSGEGKNARAAFSPAPSVGEGKHPQDAGMGDAHARISEAARQLHEERDAWLNPPGVDPHSEFLKQRTLTNLYNALAQWRGIEEVSVPVEAQQFAPRLDELHTTLDHAVCDAYGWPHDILHDEEEMLRRLLALNLQRAGG